MNPRESTCSSKGVALGQQAALDAAHITAVRSHLAANGSPRDRALFALGLDTMLRGCDLTRLRVGDVLDHAGQVRESFAVVQGKISAAQAKPVVVYLTPATRVLVAVHVAHEGKPRDAYLFTGKGRNRPLSTDMLRILVKSWCAAVGLDPGDHANHTLRRTKASALYAATRDLELTRQALGHSDIRSTQRYLSVGQEAVKSACLALNL
jgi:integrase